jgi:hypothetical protein
MNEPSIRESLLAAISPDFEIHREVGGVHPEENERVRADLLCFPRTHLQQRGFAPVWFAVETKHIDFAKHESDRLYRTLWQAVSYRCSEFVMASGSIRPAFAAVAIGEMPRNYGDKSEQAQRRRWQILMEFGLYANVGYFRLRSPAQWSLYFGQARYFDSATGLNTVPRGLTRWVGSRAVLPRPSEQARSALNDSTGQAASASSPDCGT